MAILLALVCDVLLRRCHFPIRILGLVRCLIASIPDFCPLSYLTKVLYLAFKPQTLHIVGFIINQMAYFSTVLLCFTDKTFCVDSTYVSY